jgi:hypothetical protein
MTSNIPASWAWYLFVFPPTVHQTRCVQPINYGWDDAMLLPEFHYKGPFSFCLDPLLTLSIPYCLFLSHATFGLAGATCYVTAAIFSGDGLVKRKWMSLITTMGVSLDTGPLPQSSLQMSTAPSIPQLYPWKSP